MMQIGSLFKKYEQIKLKNKSCKISPFLGSKFLYKNQFYEKEKNIIITKVQGKSIIKNLITEIKENRRIV